MTLEEAYEHLGLCPLHRFMRGALAKNKQERGNVPGQAPSDFHRGLGATTWMCVQAALTLAENNVLIVGVFGYRDAREMAVRVARFCEKLGAAEIGHDHSHHPDPTVNTPSYIEMSNAAELRWTSVQRGTQVTGQAGFRGVIFNDEEWAERMVRRAKGPFAMIREIRRAPVMPFGSEYEYRAYAEDQEFLMELTAEGARALCKQDRTIRQVGWGTETVRFSY
jgi:hypothetical protein